VGSKTGCTRNLEMVSCGTPIVMVHGNPVWSFVYRHLIKGLQERYR